METDGMRRHRQLNGRDRPGFYHRPVKGISAAMIIFGCVSVIIGIAALVVALCSTCTYKIFVFDDYQHYDAPHCHYDHIYMSPGIWSGVTFVACGIVGLLASRRKTTCMIACMMALSVVTASVSIASIVISIWANFDDKYPWNHLGRSELEGHLGELPMQTNPLPLTLHIASGLIGLMSLAGFILSWLIFAFASGAVCCSETKGYLEIEEPIQHPLLQSTGPVMHATTQLRVNENESGQDVVQAQTAQA